MIHSKEWYYPVNKEFLCLSLGLLKESNKTLFYLLGTI